MTTVRTSSLIRPSCELTRKAIARSVRKWRYLRKLYCLIEWFEEFEKNSLFVEQFVVQNSALDSASFHCLKEEQFIVSKYVAYSVSQKVLISAKFYLPYLWKRNSTIWKENNLFMVLKNIRFIQTSYDSFNKIKCQSAFPIFNDI